jgi:hypothetical protein
MRAPLFGLSTLTVGLALRVGDNLGRSDTPPTGRAGGADSACAAWLRHHRQQEVDGACELRERPDGTGLSSLVGSKINSDEMNSIKRTLAWPTERARPRLRAARAGARTAEEGQGRQRENILRVSGTSVSAIDSSMIHCV